jgi:hypothetical protein
MLARSRRTPTATRGACRSSQLAAGSSVIQAGIVRRRSGSWTRNERRGFSLTKIGRNRWPTNGWNGYRTVMNRPLVVWVFSDPDD